VLPAGRAYIVSVYHHDIQVIKLVFTDRTFHGTQFTYIITEYVYYFPGIVYFFLAVAANEFSFYPKSI
jgi:hypothetical protein